MYVIQRTKTATDPKAVRGDDPTARRVEDYYTAKLAAGQPVGIVTAVDVVPVAPPVTKPDPDAGD